MRRPPQRSRFPWPVGAALGMLAGLAACHHPPRSGRSGFVVLPPPPPVAVAGEAHVATELPRAAARYVAPTPPRRPELPVYPPAALAAGAGLRVVHVRVQLDETGRVTDVAPSWRGVEWPDEHGRAFFDAVVTTVRRWQFNPGILEHFEREDGDDYRFVRAERIADTIDLQFTFEASGRVR